MQTINRHAVANLLAKQIWIGFGLTNAAIVGVTNLYSSVLLATRSEGPVQSICYGLLCIAVSVMKAGIYLASGPLGSYRILVGCTNSARADDLGYMAPITCVFTLGRIRHKYMLWPLGTMSLTPVGKRDYE